MMRLSTIFVVVGLVVVGCGGGEEMPTFGGGAKASGGTSDQAAASACGGNQDKDAPDSYEMALEKASMLDDQSNTFASDIDFISPADVDHWVVRMDDRFQWRDKFSPWAFVMVNSSNVPVGFDPELGHGFLMADPTVVIELCGTFKGERICERAGAGQAVLIRLPVSSIGSDDGLFHLQVSAADGSQGCGSYQIRWGTRQDDAYYGEAIALVELSRREQ